MRVAVPQSRRFTKDQYHFMPRQGWFLDQRVELIGGEIIDMPAPGNDHDVGVQATTKTLETVFGAGFWVRPQMGLDINISSEPLPDVAVVAGDFRTHEATPKAALLLVEVSESSPSFDRNRKASLYASAGMADYWILNLVDRKLEVRRTPVPDPAERFDARYADLLAVLAGGDVIAPLAAPNSPVAVADLLP